MVGDFHFEMCSSIRFSIASNRIRYMGYILYITFAPSLCLSGLLALRPWSPILPSHRQLHAGPVWSARSPAAGIELQLTWRILVPLLAPVGLSKPTTTQPQRQRVKGWRRNCSKGPGRIFVYLLHILGFTATTTSSRFCGRYLLCLPSLPQQWHSREPQQHNSGNNKGHSYHTSGHQLLQVRPFDFTQLIYLLPENLQESLSLPLSLSIPLCFHLPLKGCLSGFLPVSGRSGLCSSCSLTSTGFLCGNLLTRFPCVWHLKCYYNAWFECSDKLLNRSQCVSMHSTHSFSILAQPHEGEYVIQKHTQQ